MFFMSKFIKQILTDIIDCAINKLGL